MISFNLTLAGKVTNYLSKKTPLRMAERSEEKSAKILYLKRNFASRF